MGSAGGTEERAEAAGGDGGPSESAWAVLGFLRFALALIVFGDHMPGVVDLPDWALRFSRVGAYAAVLAFFFVSGYSIAHSLRRGAAGFYGRRIDRLYPLYLWGLVLCAVPFLVWGPVVVTDVGAYQAPATVWPFIGSFFFLQTALFPPLMNDHPTWSLTLEVAYYAAAPLLARLPGRALVALIGLSAVLYLYREPLGARDLAVPDNHCSAPFLLWAWLGGFWFYRHRDDLRAQLAVPLVGVWLLCCDDATPGKYSALVLVGSLVLAGQAHTFRPWPARWVRLGDYLGNLSYPLYILHMPLFVLIGGAWRHHGPAVCLAVLAASAASYHAIDAPYQRCARRRRAQPEPHGNILPAR